MARQVKPLTASLHTVRVVRTLATLVRGSTRTTIDDDVLAAQIFALLGNLPPSDPALMGEVMLAIAGTSTGGLDRA